MNIFRIIILPLFLILPLFSLSQNTVVVQAETGTFSGSLETEHSGYTGTGFVDTENETGSYIELEFSIKDAGETTIHIYYAHGKSDDRTTAIYINDSLQVESLSFTPTGSFTTWTKQTTQVTLREGTNVFRMEALTSGGLVNTDKIEIEGEDGPVQYQLSLTITGSGTIILSPDADYYNTGTEVTLTAINTEFAEFDYWDGDLSGSEMQQTITMDKDKTVKACFVKLVASVYYCSPEGDDDNGDGSFENPFYNLQNAVDLASEGDTIYLMGGEYQYSERININQSGDKQNYIFLYAYNDKRPILDFSDMDDEDANQGIRLTGSYWHFYGFDITNAGDNGLLIERNKPSGGDYSDIAKLTDEAHDNIIEYCNFYRNRDTGVQLKNLAAYNQIINCDSYYNRDSSDGDADGFAPKLTVGTGNYFYGCRAWNNSDDGWDLYLKCKDDDFPQSMVTTIENCWCWKNGFLENGNESDGNGNGFKLGGSNDKDESHDVVLIRCLSFENLQKGFDQNSNVGNMTLINCTGYATPYTDNSSHYTYRIDGTTLADTNKLVEYNNIAVCDGKKRKESSWAPCEMKGGEQYTCNYLLSDTNFVSVSTNGMDAERNSDGSLPDVTFMHINSGNTLLIDQGTTTDEIKYNGNAPDLGCFETNETNIVEKLTYSIDNAFSLYPNPASNLLSLKTTKDTNNIEILLFNLNGQQIATLAQFANTKKGQQFTINLENIASGTYILQCKTQKNSQNQKLVVIK